MSTLDHRILDAVQEIPGISVLLLFGSQMREYGDREWVRDLLRRGLRRRLLKGQFSGFATG